MAAAAYRSGSLLKDERTGTLHRYDKRTGIAETFILTPNGSPQQFFSRADLWNGAEASEVRKNARVAREVVLALPHELTDTDRIALAKDMASYLVHRYQVAVDVAIHAPVVREGHDPRNHHAHLLFTTRALTSEGFGAKTRILDDKQAGPQEVELLREVWETLANDALARAGFSDVKIDRRTLEGQGIDNIPQTHIGHRAKALQEAVKEDEDTEEGGSKGDGGKEGRTEDNSGNLEEEEDRDGKSSSGGMTPSRLETKENKDASEIQNREIPYKTMDKGRRRYEFVEEIQQLNERRAAFASDVPIKDQIKHIETLMEKLDHRVQHLETLKERSSLGHQILNTLSDVIKLSKDLVFGREKHRETIVLSETEKNIRAERQREHYGRGYRTGLHEQIKIMRSNLDWLDHLKVSYTAYNNLVEQLEGEVQYAKTGIMDVAKEKTLEDLKSAFQIATSKIIIPKSVSELSIKAFMKKAILPEYRHPDTETITSWSTASLRDDVAPERNSALLRPLFSFLESFKGQAISPIWTPSHSPNGIKQTIEEVINQQGEVEEAPIPQKIIQSEELDSETTQSISDRNGGAISALEENLLLQNDIDTDPIPHEHHQDVPEILYDPIHPVDINLDNDQNRQDTEEQEILRQDQWENIENHSNPQDQIQQDNPEPEI